MLICTYGNGIFNFDTLKTPLRHGHRRRRAQEVHQRGTRVHKKGKRGAREDDS